MRQWWQPGGCGARGSRGGRKGSREDQPEGGTGGREGGWREGRVSRKGARALRPTGACIPLQGRNRVRQRGLAEVQRATRPQAGPVMRRQSYRLVARHPAGSRRRCSTHRCLPSTPLLPLLSVFFPPFHSPSLSSPVLPSPALHSPPLPLQLTSVMRPWRSSTPMALAPRMIRGTQAVHDQERGRMTDHLGRRGEGGGRGGGGRGGDGRRHGQGDKERH